MKRLLGITIFSIAVSIVLGWTVLSVRILMWAYGLILVIPEWREGLQFLIAISVIWLCAIGIVSTVMLGAKAGLRWV